jgi:hypothetical protein
MEDKQRAHALATWWRNLWVPGYTRPAYVIPACVAFLFVGHAYEDAGWQGAGPYAFVLGISLVQLVRPTAVGWALTTIPFVAYLVAFAVEAPRSATGEWLFFLLVGLVPTAVLAWARPRRRESARPGKPSSSMSSDAG